MLAVFDLDGVLADTRSAVRDAYAIAGVAMPDEAWGHPWMTWLPKYLGGNVLAARELHTRKTIAYAEMVRTGQVSELPAAGVVRALTRRTPPSVLVLTSASMDSARPLMHALHLKTNILAGVQLTLSQRVGMVTEWAHISPGAYFDDDRAQAEVVVAHLEHWTACHVTNETTTNDIEKALTWTQ